MKKLIYLVEFTFVYIFFIFFKLLGYKISSNLGFIIGKLFGPMFRSKKLIVENLKKSNISLKQNYKQVAGNVLGNYGRIFSEYPYLKSFRNGGLNNFIEIDGKNHLENIRKEKKRVVFVSGHFNNFELMAMQIEKAGIELSAIYRPLNNIFLNKIMEKIRTKYICKNQIKKGRTGTRQIIKNLKKGCSIALMIDQRVREGSKVKFFGDLATTTTIPAQLIKKYKCELVPIYIERKEKYYFKMHISKPIKVNSKKTTEDITLFLNTVLEKMILKNPEQWIWTHDRWKK
jgi:KDO2-lipid IV(A) lauroyltransferase